MSSQFAGSESEQYWSSPLIITSGCQVVIQPLQLQHHQTNKSPAATYDTSQWHTTCKLWCVCGVWPVNADATVCQNDSSCSKQSVCVTKGRGILWSKIDRPWVIFIIHLTMTVCFTGH